MAVVFISPKQRQKMFFIGITAMFLLFLIIVSLGVFLSNPKEVSPVLVFNKPKININMAVFDTDEFKNLQPMPEMETFYSYKAATKSKKQETGFLSAASVEEVKTILEGRGLTVFEIKEVQIGRDNPFVTYYQLAVVQAASRAAAAKPTK